MNEWRSQWGLITLSIPPRFANHLEGTTSQGPFVRIFERVRFDGSLDESLKAPPVSAGVERGHQTLKDIDRLTAGTRPEPDPGASRHVGRKIMRVQNRKVLIPLVVDDKGAHEERVPTCLRELALAKSQPKRLISRIRLELSSELPGPVGQPGAFQVGDHHRGTHQHDTILDSDHGAFHNRDRLGGAPEAAIPVRVDGHACCDHQRHQHRGEPSSVTPQRLRVCVQFGPLVSILQGSVDRLRCGTTERSGAAGGRPLKQLSCACFGDWRYPESPPTTWGIGRLAVTAETQKALRRMVSRMAVGSIGASVRSMSDSWRLVRRVLALVAVVVLIRACHSEATGTPTTQDCPNPTSCGAGYEVTATSIDPNNTFAFKLVAYASLTQDDLRDVADEIRAYTRRDRYALFEETGDMAHSGVIWDGPRFGSGPRVRGLYAGWFVIR